MNPLQQCRTLENQRTKTKSQIFPLSQNQIQLFVKVESFCRWLMLRAGRTTLGSLELPLQVCSYQQSWQYQLALMMVHNSLSRKHYIRANIKVLDCSSPQLQGWFQSSLVEVQFVWPICNISVIVSNSSVIIGGRGVCVAHICVLDDVQLKRKTNVFGDDSSRRQIN